MRLAFAGTPAFSVVALDALHQAGHQIVGVFTQPDRAAGRGRKLTASPVSLRASKLGLPQFKPERFREAAQQQLRDLAPDVMVVVAYGLILPQAALDVPVRGCLNIHASLLPRWRGAAPIQRAIEAGDRETGITIMQMEAGLDTGPMLQSAAVAISEQTTAADLHDRLAELGGRLIVSTLARLAADAITATPQPSEGVTYAHKLDKAEAQIDWQQPAAVIARRVRAFHPVPVAWTLMGETRIRIWNAEVCATPSTAMPGTVLDVGADAVTIACGQNSLRITVWQWPGGTAQAVDRSAAARVPVGTRLS